MGKNNRYDRESKSISSHHISFGPNDQEKELKEYLLKQYDNLGLTQYFDWEYVVDLREKFFFMLKGVDINYILDEFPDILDLNSHDYTDDLESDQIVYFLGINFNKNYGDILSLDVYNVSFDYITCRFIIKLGDVVIESIPADIMVKLPPLGIKVVSEKAIDLLDIKAIGNDLHVNRTNEIRETLLDPTTKKKLTQFENKLYTYGLEKGQHIYFIDDKIKPKSLHKNINWDKLDKTSLCIEKIYPEKGKVIISNGVQKFTLTVDDLHNIGIKGYDDTSHYDELDEGYDDYDT